MAGRKPKLQPLKKRTILCTDEEWKELDRIAREEIHDRASMSDGFRYLIREHQKKMSGAGYHGS